MSLHETIPPWPRFRVGQLVRFRRRPAGMHRDDIGVVTATSNGTCYVHVYDGKDEAGATAGTTPYGARELELVDLSTPEGVEEFLDEGSVDGAK